MAKARNNVTKFPAPVVAATKVVGKAVAAPVKVTKAPVKAEEKAKPVKAKSQTFTQILKAYGQTAGTHKFEAVTLKGEKMEATETAVPQLYVRKSKHTSAPGFVLLTVKTFATLKDLQAAQDGE